MQATEATLKTNCPKITFLTPPHLKTPKHIGDIAIKSAETMYGTELYHHAKLQIFTPIG